MVKYAMFYPNKLRYKLHGNHQYKKAVLSQRKPLDAALNFDT